MNAWKHRPYEGIWACLRICGIRHWQAFGLQRTCSPLDWLIIAQTLGFNLQLSPTLMVDWWCYTRIETNNMIKHNRVIQQKRGVNLETNDINPWWLSVISTESAWRDHVCCDIKGNEPKKTWLGLRIKERNSTVRNSLEMFNIANIIQMGKSWDRCQSSNIIKYGRNKNIWSGIAPKWLLVDSL